MGKLSNDPLAPPQSFHLHRYKLKLAYLRSCDLLVKAREFNNGQYARVFLVFCNSWSFIKIPTTPSVSPRQGSTDDKSGPLVICIGQVDLYCFSLGQVRSTIQCQLTYTFHLGWVAGTIEQNLPQSFLKVLFWPLLKEKGSKGAAPPC